MLEKCVEDFLNKGELVIPAAGPDYLILDILCMKENEKAIARQFSSKKKIRKVKAFFKSTSVIKISYEASNSYSEVYVKTGWENILRQAVAMHLNNALTDRAVEYVLYRNVIATKGIPGIVLDDYIVRKDDSVYAYNYGLLEEYSKIIGLVDRDARNIILKENGELWNIDFGHSFHHDGTLPLSRAANKKPIPFPGKNVLPDLNNGIEQARYIIKDNLENKFNMIKRFLDAITKQDMAKMAWGHTLLKGRTDLYHPKEILMKYVSNCGWYDLAQALND